MPSGVYVSNLREVRRWFSTFEPDLTPVLRNSLKQVVERSVTPAVRARVPHSSGAAAASVRARSAGNVMYVVAGSKKVPYFGWLDYGGVLRPVGKRHNPIRRPIVRGGRYLIPGVNATRQLVVNDVSETIARFIRVH